MKQEIEAEEARFNRCFIAIAVDYTNATNPTRKPLPETKAQAERLRGILSDKMSDLTVDADIDYCDPIAILKLIDKELESAGDDDVLAIYLAGHGEPDGNNLYVAGPEAGQAKSYNSISVAGIGSSIARSSAARVLLIVDACYSGIAVGELTAHMEAVQSTSRDRDIDFSVIVSASALDPAQDGWLGRALNDVLTEGSLRWSDKDRYIDSTSLATALRTWAGEGEETLPTSKANPNIRRNIASDGPILTNPRFQALSPTFELAVLNLESAAGAHFLRSASGLDADIEVGEGAWFFTGREEILASASQWLASTNPDGSNLFVVTGPPGSGKSAILGRIALTLSDEGRELLAKLDPDFDLADYANRAMIQAEPSVVAVLHARERTEAQIRDKLATALQLDENVASDTLATFTTAVAQRVGDLRAKTGRSPIVIIDALDEAIGTDRYKIAELLGSLSRQAGLRIMIGTRPARPAGQVGVGSETDTRGLLDEMGVREPDVDLGRDRDESIRDISAYLVKRLIAGSVEVRYNEQEAVRIANELTRSIGAVFLYARLAAHLLLGQDKIVFGQGWERELPAIADFEIFAQSVEQDLARIDDEQLRDRVRKMLMALSFAEGSGFPRNLWVVAASAITGQKFDDDDVLETMNEAGWYLVEAAANEQAVYRLFHDELIRYFQDAATREL